MAFMLKSDKLGYYNVEYNEETGEIINDPRAVKKEIKPVTIATVKGKQ
jgi:hypothetical protein